MKRLWHWLVLALVLILAGVGMAAYKAEVLGYPLQPGTTEDSWTVQARVQLQPGDGPIQVQLRLPRHTPDFARLQEDFISRGFGLSISEEPWSRAANWAVRRSSGQQTLYYRAIFYRDSNRPEIAGRPPYPPVPQLEEPFQTAMLALVDDVRRQSADIISFSTEMISRLNAPVPGEEVALFVNAPDWHGSRVELTRLLLAGARIPTVQVNGVMLTEMERRAVPVRWLAVHNDQRWIFLDPATGQRGLPENFLLWWVGDEPVVEASGASVSDVQWSVRRNPIGALDLAERRARAHDSMAADLSLLNLPVQTQAVYAVLLLVPIGAFVIVIMRNLVGVRSFGTFMPVLIALAFGETGLVGGILLFAIVVALGLIFRFYLERLRLLLVPRLTAVLGVVVLLLVGVSVFSNRLGFEVGLSVGLFPMVILAMVIERMSIIWEERGPQDALLEGIGSLIIAVLAYLAMGLVLVQHLVFVFPELILVVLGLTVLMGRYTGYRLTELMRFRALAR